MCVTVLLVTTQHWPHQSEHCSTPSQKVPSGVHVTKMIIYDLFLFILPLATYNTCYNNSGHLGKYIV